MSKHLLLRNGFVREHGEFWRRDERNTQAVPRRASRGWGVYALYDKNRKLIYVGLSDNSLRRRIWAHLKNRPAAKFFSWYRIERTKYLHEIETLLIHVGNPVQNKKRQHFKMVRRPLQPPVR